MGWRGGGGGKLTRSFACKGKNVRVCVRERGGEQRGLGFPLGMRFARAERYQFFFGGGEDWE